LSRRAAALISSLAAVLTLAVALHGATGAARTATCADFSTQAAAQEVANTRDQDGDGVFCETLRCPCAGPATPAPAPAPQQPTPSAESCTTTKQVVKVGISQTKYPALLRHIRTATRAGWPALLTINRDGADERRDQLLDDGHYPTRPGMDRDEWPMAFARADWRAHVAYVPSRQNRGAGASIGQKLRRYCDGTRFRVVGY
jgi:hypothetical protein